MEYIIALFLTCLAIIHFAFKDGKWTCKNYILNTYLYILLAIIIIFMEAKYLQNYHLLKAPFFLIFVISIVLLFALFYVRNIYLVHILWLAFILFMGYFFTFTFKQMSSKGILESTLITTFVIVFSLSFIAFWKPQLISLSWGPVLLMALLVGIILRITLMFLGESYSMYSLMLSYAMVFLFSLYILYDTKMIQVMAKRCSLNNVNYAVSSLNIFLDILNLISNFTDINN